MKSNLKLLSVSRIWDASKHNGMTDLIGFHGQFFCCFREGLSHAGEGNGTIRILRSKDGDHWTSAAVLKKNGFDLRDPHFSIMPDGRLMLTMGGSIFINEHYEGCSPHVSFSSDGIKWSAAQQIPLPNEWIWRITWHKKVGYGFSYRLTNPLIKRKPWVLTLFKTKDGLTYKPVKIFNMPNYPSEATIRFLDNDTMVALLRRRGYAWIGSSKPGYDEWKWKSCGHSVGGPNFVILPDGRMLAGGRDFKTKADETKGFTLGRTALGFMTLGKYEPEFILPSKGDNSYPGMVFRDGILYVSYYSSHEKKACIYFAKVLVSDRRAL